MSSFIPDKWETKKFDEIFHVVTDYVANGSFASLRENVSYKETEDYAILVRLQDYSNKFQKSFVYVDEHAYNFLNKSKLNPNDLVICNVGAAGTIFKVPDLKKPMTLGPNSILVRTNESSDYMYYYIQSCIGQQKLKDITTTTAQPKFNKTDFKSIKCILPPLKEQQKIAEILSSVDAAIEKTEQVIAKTEEVKIGITEKLLFNSSFSKYKISDICDLIDGDRSSKYPKQGELVDEGILFLNTSNIKNHSLKLDNCNFISKQKFDELSKGKLNYNDVIITLRGTIGNVALFKCKYETGFINAQMSIMRALDSKVLPNYLYYLMSSRCIQGKLKEVCTGSAQPQLPLKILKEVCVPIPSLVEQQKICDTLNQFVENIDIEYKKLDKLLEVKKGLIQQLLTGQVRVKVD